LLAPPSGKRRRVLFVSNTYLPDSIGGVEIHIRGLTRALAPSCDVALFRRGADPGQPPFAVSREQVEGLEVHRLNYLFHDATSFPMLVSNASIRARFEELLVRLEPDLVHVHHVTCLTTEILDAVRAAGVPLVLSLHDYWMGCPRGQRLTSALNSCERVERARCARCYADTWPHFFPRESEGRRPSEQEWQRAAEAAYDKYHARIRAALDCAGTLVVPSEFTRGQFIAYGVPAERLHVVPYGIDPPQSPMRRDAPGSPFRFGFIGTVFPSKGVHVLLEAFRALPKGSATLDIHGEDVPYHNDPGYGARVRRQARDLEAVNFHGRYANDRVYGILGSLDALVMPSIWFETYGIVMREAFLAGVPVIASNLGAMAEGIDHGRSGLLFRRGDAEDLGRKMRELMSDPELWLRLARAEKPILSVRQNAEQLVRLYDEAFSRVRGEHF
jgi:glycosyltransferase involved in cell wall biosynthesis